jgi:hypothetical protein
LGVCELSVTQHCTPGLNGLWREMAG